MSQATDENAADEEATPSEIADERLAQAEEEIASLKDKWLRSVADLENYKKRTRREIEDAVFRARQDLLSSFFPTADNLERALELARDNENLFKGIEMVVREFNGALTKFGIESVPGVGHAFDPAIHDALQQIDSPDHAPGVVVREFEKGYRQGDRLLRPARVIIAGPGSTGGGSPAA